MNSESVWQHFAAATELLAGSGSIKDRLFEAYHNELAELEFEQLPQELRAEYIRWHGSMNRVRPLRGEDAVRATLRKISGIEADRLAQTLVKLSIRLLRISQPNAQQAADVRLQAAGGGSVVQLFPG
jgi:hypothetical protein